MNFRCLIPSFAHPAALRTAQTLPLTLQLFLSGSVELGLVQDRVGAWLGRPALRSNVAASTDWDAECSGLAAWSPAPACSTLHGEMVKSEGSVRAQDTDESPADDVARVMSIVREARATDVDCSSDGHETEHNEVDRWGSILTAKRYNWVFADSKRVFA